MGIHRVCVSLRILRVDWIEDSILERKRRLRTSRAVESSHRGPNGEITLSWLWAQLLKAIVASQTWLVVSLAGEASSLIISLIEA